ncbi:MAG: hypothetical protein LBT67_00590 [Holosporaceae bacterium]|jgi:glucose-6-phosphate isomerase|nr:hypothetical protein [Holosporaceae bacterium]
MISHCLVNKTHEVDYGIFPDVAQLDCISIVDGDHDLWFLENTRLMQWLFARQFMIFGTGGSSLGGQCIREISSQKENVTFINNLDPHTIRETLGKISDDVNFLFISKSGETLETIAQLLIIIEFLKSSGKTEEEIADRIVVITEAEPSSLRDMILQYNFFFVNHPKRIGGRFSVFSAVGMLPALICGIDPMKIRKAAKNYLDNYFRAAVDGAFFTKENYPQHVFFIYSDKLSCFGQWLAQLYAESTGKLEAGITPLIARGTVDQHSQLQLYLAGPKNKCFTFLLEKQETKLRIPSEFTPPGFEYLKGKNLQSIFEAQCDATLDSVLKKHLPIRKIEFDPLTPEVLGELFMHFMLEVIMVCNLMNVNAFDQQAVEYAKNRTKELLSKNP